MSAGNAKPEEFLEQKCQEAVAKLKELHVNFVAIDFDQTMIQIHTGGVWKGTANDLATQVRPVFRILVGMIMAQGGIGVAIVTFSPQVAMIRQVLEMNFGEEVAGQIPIRGQDRSWTYEGGGCLEGKQPHMASAATELMSVQQQAPQISKNTTLLIDDDSNNIRIALREGTRAIWFNPALHNSTAARSDEETTPRILQDIINLV